MSLEEIKSKIGENVTYVRGIYTKRVGFFYTNGNTSDKVVARIKANLPEAIIIDHGEVWKPFNGGAPLAKQSHWWVKFKLPKGV